MALFYPLFINLFLGRKLKDAQKADKGITKRNSSFSSF